LIETSGMDVDPEALATVVEGLPERSVGELLAAATEG
jgi:ribosomal protein L12E/L44/L45/RPP1/RPP2